MFVHAQCLRDLSDASMPKGFEERMDGRRPRPRGPAHRSADPRDESRITSGQNFFFVHPPKSTPVDLCPGPGERKTRPVSNGLDGGVDCVTLCPSEVGP